MDLSNKLKKAKIIGICCAILFALLLLLWLKKIIYGIIIGGIGIGIFMAYRRVRAFKLSRSSNTNT